ncbi:MAG: FAD-dependent oxidoreductase [Clostridia bacterium]|nr:FAD-dependent oxidoreductase [Clostridia bacterium]
MYDVIIVGGGPAGLSAALYALRAEKTVLVLEKNNFGGQIAWSPRVENYPGLMSVSGAALADNLLSQVLEKGGEIELTEVLGISDFGLTKTVRTADGDFEAKAVILATGAKHRRLGLPREEELTGNGVCYCAVCDGAFYKGRPVAVAGGGDAALQDALLLSASCSEVYIIHRRGEFRAEAANVSAVRERPNIRLVMSSRVMELLGEKELSGVTIYHSSDDSRSHIAVDGLFVAVGYQPENGAFAEFADLDDNGWFDSGEDCRTRTPGVFAAGDCRAKTVRQLTTAVGDGAVAAVAACRYVDGL